MDPTTSSSSIGAALIPRNLTPSYDQNEIITAQVFNSRLQEAIQEREAAFKRVFESKEKIIKDLSIKIETLQAQIEGINLHIQLDHANYELEKLKLKSKLDELDTVIIRLETEIKIKEIFKKFFENIVLCTHQNEEAKGWPEKSNLGKRLNWMIDYFKRVSEVPAIGDPETNLIFRAIAGNRYPKNIDESLEAGKEIPFNP